MPEAIFFDSNTGYTIANTGQSRLFSHQTQYILATIWHFCWIYRRSSFNAFCLFIVLFHTSFPEVIKQSHISVRWSMSKIIPLFLDNNCRIKELVSIVIFYWLQTVVLIAANFLINICHERTHWRNMAR